MKTVELRKQFADENKIIISDCSLITENHSEGYIEWLEGKLTRPAVSEGEMAEAFGKARDHVFWKDDVTGIPMCSFNAFKAAIKELLNR